jgi:cell division protein FtsL
MKIIFMSFLTTLACFITFTVSVAFAAYSADKELIVTNLHQQIDQMSLEVHKLSVENVALRSKNMNLQADLNRVMTQIQNLEDPGCPD